MQVIKHHPAASIIHAGFLPQWLDDNDPRNAKEQLNDGYAFGGWQPFKGFKLGKGDTLCYPGDPPQKPFLEFRLEGHPERVLMYEHSWVAVIEPDGSFEVCRMD